MSAAIEIHEGPDHSDMIERTGVGREWLDVLKADNAAVWGVDGDVKYTARGKALDEGALLLDGERRIERA